jgi:hypothetical protein
VFDLIEYLIFLWSCGLTGAQEKAAAGNLAAAMTFANGFTATLPRV